MPECDYCADSFPDEEAYLRHLADEHEGELSRIDQRRVERLGGASGSESEMSSNAKVGLAGLSVVMVLAVGLTGYLVVTGGSSGSTDEPTQVGSVHEHGRITITIEGESLDLLASEFRLADDAFHTEGSEQISGDTYLWHKHAQGVTLQYALGTFGIEVDDAGTELTYDGTTYRADDPGTTIEITVDGEPVAPGEFELDSVTDETAAINGEGQNIVVNVTTEN
jgi:hypothetical protein